MQGGVEYTLSNIATHEFTYVYDKNNRLKCTDPQKSDKSCGYKIATVRTVAFLFYVAFLSLYSIGLIFNFNFNLMRLSIVQQTVSVYTNRISCKTKYLNFSYYSYIISISVFVLE